MIQYYVAYMYVCDLEGHDKIIYGDTIAEVNKTGIYTQKVDINYLKYCVTNDLYNRDNIEYKDINIKNIIILNVEVLEAEDLGSSFDLVYPKTQKVTIG